MSFRTLESLKLETVTLSDITQLSELLKELFSIEEEFEPDTEKQRRGLRLILEQPAMGRILVARLDGVIVGMVSVLFSISTAEGERVVILEDMVVRGTFRQKGVGSALLQFALEHARAEKCARITLLTDKTNEGAIRFYHRHGFVTSPMIPLRLNVGFISRT